MKNILVISSSPRRNGNSDLLCDEFIKGALEAGNKVEKVFLADKKINVCLGCGACYNTSKCIQKDDMVELNDKMVGDIARQLGIRPGRDNGQDILRKLENKSDAELEREILKIKEQLRANNITYEKQISMLKSLAPKMNGAQRARLQRVIELLQK